MVALARNGDEDAFAELVRRRQAWLRNLMRRLSNDETLADDLAQQTLLQAWRDISKLKDPRKFPGWLRRVAMNTWHQHLRKNDALRNAQTELEHEAAAPSKTNVRLDLDRALAQLSADARTCVVLSYHEGLSHGEIADATGFALGTVKSHIRRGAEQLKQLLSAYQSTSTDVST